MTFPFDPANASLWLMCAIATPMVVPGSLAAWHAAVRPCSLPMSASPVVVGLALAWGQGAHLPLWPSLAALAAAVLMQVVTNLQNDLGYTERGGESAGMRHGLPRATARGWLSRGVVRGAIVATAALATALGLALALWRGWPVIAIGVASLLAALAYMAGPRPIAYTCWGEATVLVFFGPVAVCGTAWLLTGEFGLADLFAGIALGSVAGAALGVNNHRDRAHDALAGRRTFAVLHGHAASLRLIGWLLAGGFVALIPVAWLSGHAAALVALVFAPHAWTLWREIAAAGEDPAPLTPLLLRTFALVPQMAFLLSAGLVVDRLLF
jgi:1,4-dihydroxy-2-naphthoate octaprenyltransferase